MGEGFILNGMSALAFSWMDFVLGVLSRTGAGFVSPARSALASVEVSHWPCLVMPMGTDFVFVLVDGFEDGGGGEEGDFVLAGAAAEEDAYA